MGGSRIRVTVGRSVAVEAVRRPRRERVLHPLVGVRPVTRGARERVAGLVGPSVVLDRERCARGTRTPSCRWSTVGDGEVGVVGDGGIDVRTVAVGAVVQVAGLPPFGVVVGRPVEPADGTVIAVARYRSWSWGGRRGRSGGTRRSSCWRPCRGRSGPRSSTRRRQRHRRHPSRSARRCGRRRCEARWKACTRASWSSDSSVAETLLPSTVIDHDASATPLGVTTAEIAG